MDNLVSMLSGVYLLALLVVVCVVAIPVLTFGLIVFYLIVLMMYLYLKSKM